MTRKLILVVEDNPDNSRLAEKILTKAGYDCIIRTNAVDGLTFMMERKPDLVLMDMALPGMDGWQATEILKTNEQIADVPVIALTAHAMSDDRAKALAAGCDEFMTKPYRATELLAMIQRLLHG